jgi:hypothetical protein
MATMVWPCEENRRRIPRGALDLRFKGKRQMA